MRNTSDIAAQVVDLVRKSAPAAEAEVIAQVDTLALTRFANSVIHQNVAEATPKVTLRVHVDGRTGSGSTSLTTSDALAGLVDRTLAAARLSPVDAGWPGLAPTAALATSGTVDEAVAGAEPSARAGLVRAFVDAAGGLTTAGYVRTRMTTAAFANSAGQAVSGATTEIAMDGIARTATSDGSARLASAYLSDIDGAKLGARAAAKARAGQDPVELPPGQYEVVLEPTAVVDVLSCLTIYGFDGKAVNEKRSFLQAGQAQFDPAVTIFDDAVSPGAVGLPFDSEGTPKRLVPIVTKGVVEGPLQDRRTAKVAGLETTGSASVSDRGFVAALAANATIEPGPGDAPVTEVDGPMADSTVAALVSGVSRGVLVTDHWYTRVLDPRTLVMTGLTRNGVWLIENGEITAPLRNFRFTQSYPRALAPGAVLGVGTQGARLPNPYGAVSMQVPALRLASWNYTGGASG
jgi:predicted Zn-dependent protease